MYRFRAAAVRIASSIRKLEDGLQGGILQALPTRTASRLLPGILYLLGILHWLGFFTFAKLTGLDWRLTLAYQALLKEALQTGRVPYVSTFDHYTNRFLGSPETPLSPQYLLLPWTDPWTFNVLNLCFLYSLSFIGLALFKRRYALSWLPFTALYLLFNFNGCIVSRVAVGHTMWYGYFLLPLLYLCLFDILEDRNVRRAACFLAGVLFLMELQGSFHLLVWCFMFLALVALFDRRHFRPIAAAMLWAVGLDAFRLAPAAVTLRGLSLNYVHAFESLGTLVDRLTVRFPPVPPLEGAYFYCHELDCYVGLIGLAALIGFGWLYPYRSATGRIAGQWALYPAVLAMVALSMAPVWKHFYETGLPLFRSQRVPARLVVLPVTACIFLAVPRLQLFLRAPATPKGVKWLLALVPVPLAHAFYAHSSLWTVSDVETIAWESVTTFLPVSLLAPDMTDASTRLYVYTVWVSTAFSLAVAAAWILVCTRLSPTASTRSGLPAVWTHNS